MKGKKKKRIKSWALQEQPHIASWGSCAASEAHMYVGEYKSQIEHKVS